MSDGVKFIFKTLIKIPCIVFAFYFVLNLFAFSLTYFKLLGFSYVVMQVAVENNYIPAAELYTLNNYLDSITDTGVVDNARIILAGDPAEGESPDDASVVKKQYGGIVTVGVGAHYRWIWPLMPKEQTVGNTGFLGWRDPQTGQDRGEFNGFLGDTALEALREQYAENTYNNIIIKYTVPGLKYYPDLQ